MPSAIEPLTLRLVAQCLNNCVPQQKWIPGDIILTTLTPSFGKCLEILEAPTSSCPNDLSRPVLGWTYFYPSSI